MDACSIVVVIQCAARVAHRLRKCQTIAAPWPCAPSVGKSQFVTLKRRQNIKCLPQFKSFIETQSPSCQFLAPQYDRCHGSLQNQPAGVESKPATPRFFIHIRFLDAQQGAFQLLHVCRHRLTLSAQDPSRHSAAPCPSALWARWEERK